MKFSFRGGGGGGVEEEEEGVGLGPLFLNFLDPPLICLDKIVLKKSNVSFFVSQCLQRRLYKN